MASQEHVQMEWHNMKDQFNKKQYLARMVLFRPFLSEPQDQLIVEMYTNFIVCLILDLVQTKMQEGSLCFCHKSSYH